MDPEGNNSLMLKHCSESTSQIIQKSKVKIKKILKLK